MLPMFEMKQSYGANNSPWSLNHEVDYKYGEGTCEVAEQINKEEYLGIFMCGSNFEDHEVDSTSNAINKVYSNLDELK